MTVNPSGKEKNAIQYIGFLLGTKEFATPISLVQEIVEVPNITYLPNAPDYVEGVMNLRGRVIPVVDFPKRLCLGTKTLSIDSRIIVFQTGRIVGFIVDAITQVFRLTPDQIEPATEMMLASSEGKFVQGLAKFEKRLAILLDIPKILDCSKSKYAVEKQVTI